MSELFLSYASEDQDFARSLAEAMEAEGCPIWWDRKIYGGTDFEHEIERRLDSAPCVIVLWSAKALASRWVKGEARTALSRGVLIPVLMENVNQPIDFRSIQAIDLVGWRGDTNAAEFAKLLRSIQRIVGAASTTGEPQVSREPRLERPPNNPPPKLGSGKLVRLLRRRPVIVGALVGAVVAFIALAIYGRADMTEYLIVIGALTAAGAGIGPAIAGSRPALIAATICAFVGVGVCASLMGYGGNIVANTVLGAAPGALLGAVGTRLILRFMRSRSRVASG